MKTMLRLAMLFVAVMAIGCAGKSVNVDPNVKKEDRGFNFGERSVFIMHGTAGYNNAGLPQGDEMGVLVADLFKQRMHAKGIRVGDIGIVPALKDREREGRLQVFELAVGPMKSANNYPGFFGSFVGRTSPSSLEIELFRVTPILVERNFPDQVALSSFIEDFIRTEDERIRASSIPQKMKDKQLARKATHIIIRGQYSDPASLYEGLQKELTPYVDQWIDAYLRFVREEVQSRP
jgi:hypothetical protein